MLQLRVIVNKLNKRLTPVTDFSDKSNIVGVVTKGFTFTGEAENNMLGKWYRDRNGHFYWNGGVTEAPVIQPGQSPEHHSWWLESLQLPQIWKNFEERGERASIAVLDSGVNMNISDLTGGVVESKIFFNSVAGFPVSIDDSFGHGSHCASLAGGRNKNFITGCAPESRLFIAKISSQGSVRSFSIITEAIKWAIEKKVDVISISYGGAAPDNDLEIAINTAVNDHNILVVASIGDIVPDSTNTPCFPALFKNCLAVGATNQQQALSPITIFNNKTQINAPGENIPGYRLGATPENLSGTSQAAAIVAGIAALIISRHKKLNKKYTVSSVTDLILQHAADITAMPGQRLIAPAQIFAKI